MKQHEWVNDAFRLTNQTLAFCYNQSHIDGWSENYITTRILESLGQLGFELDWEDKPQKVRWEGFKLRGNAENIYGDIAVLVRVWLTGDRFLDGVAFYEAKRQFYKENNEAIGFTSIKKEQLARLELRSHASSILLYDVDIQKETAIASSVPTIFVQELDKKNLARTSGRLLHHYGEPWIKSLSNNFLGLQLDFRPEVVDFINKATSSTKKPTFILNASVGMITLEPKLNETFQELEYYEKWLKPDNPDPDATSEDDESDFRMR